jgi:hypothetical protein
MNALKVLLVPALLMASAAPFWDTKPPADWSIDEVQTLLTNSPWAQLVEATGKSNPAPSVQVYVASAAPMVAAEDRLRAAKKMKTDDPSWQEYRDYLVDNTGKSIVLAIRVQKRESFLDNSETKHMEDESYLRIGKRKYRVTGHFPPSSTDPFVRLVFPREVQTGDRNLIFELYVPGVGSPYRRAEFMVKDMVYHGQPAY